MAKDEQALEQEFDITVFDIPPAAAYFETIQQMQKLNAKLDVLITQQCRILAKLDDSDQDDHVEEARREIARLYEAYLKRYFEGTEIAPEALVDTIHPDDRVVEGDRKKFRHKSISF